MTHGKDYLVIGISDEYLRVIDDWNEPSLFLSDWFEVQDATIPNDWVWRDVDTASDLRGNGDPPGLDERGFYESFFDSDEDAIRKFEQVMLTMGIPYKYSKEFTLNKWKEAQANYVDEK